MSELSELLRAESALLFEQVAQAGYLAGAERPRGGLPDDRHGWHGSSLPGKAPEIPTNAH
jgi:hypothetical protein